MNTFQNALVFPVLIKERQNTKRYHILFSIRWCCITQKLKVLNANMWFDSIILIISINEYPSIHHISLLPIQKNILSSIVGNERWASLQEYLLHVPIRFTCWWCDRLTLNYVSVTQTTFSFLRCIAYQAEGKIVFKKAEYFFTLC